MKNLLYIFTCAALSLLLLHSCRKEDNTFKGTDNIVASFQLKKGDLVLKAAVSPDSIHITAPANLSLAGATATVVLSEKASISPDPAGIEDWGADQDFVVTSYNGTKRIYRYYVQRNVIAATGDILLARQADVDSLAALGISKINGSLTIGQKEGADSIYSLAVLSGITTITGDLIINPTFAGKNLDGLKNLEQVGSLLCGPEFGSYTRGPLTQIDTLSLPALKSIMTSLVLNGNGYKVLDLPALINVDGELQLLYLDSVAHIAFPKLQEVLGELTILGSGNADRLEDIKLPVLKKAGDIRISQLSSLTAVELNELSTAQSFAINSHSSLQTISAPDLATIYGNLDLSNNAALTSLDLKKLSKTGDFVMENAIALTDLDGLSALKTVGGQFRLNNLSALKNINGLTSLESVGAAFYLQSLPALEDAELEGLASLASIGGDLYIYGVPFTHFSGFKLSQVKSLNIYGSDITAIGSIDVSGLNITDKLVISSMPSPVKLKGKDSYEASVTIEGSAVEMEGFREVKDFSFTYYLQEAPVPIQTIPIQKVNGNLTIAASGFTTIRLPDLTVITGKSQVDTYGALSLELPHLTTAGEMNLNIGGSGVDVFMIPELQTVKGDLNITTGLYSGSVGDLQFPGLKTVEGKLRLFGVNEYYGNTRMTNLNGFTTLTHAGGMDIHYNMELVDFTGIKNAVSSFTAEQWSAIGNAYNPSYEDLQHGKYVQP